MSEKMHERVFGRIREHFAKKGEVAEAVGQVLHLGADAVYRRMRGETQLNLDELAKLSKAFGFSVDEVILENTTQVFFTYNTFRQQVKSFQDYLSFIHQDMKLLAQMKNVHIKYTSCEVPLFYYSFFPKLMNFKLFIWSKTVWDFEYLKNRPFSFDIVPPSDVNLATTLLDHYKLIPSTEMWNINVMDNTLNQIEYYFHAQGFQNNDDAFELFDCLLQLVDKMEVMAREGCKFSAGGMANPEIAPFKLYHNEMVYTNNTLLVKNPVKDTLYTSFGNPNFLKTSDKRITEYAEFWFDRILKKANNLTDTSDRKRQYFFNALRQKIKAHRTRLEKAANSEFTWFYG